MASNPMQRKSRNAFLLGVILTLLIAGVVVALLFLQLKQKTEDLNKELNAKVNVYTLNQNVKSGQVLTQDMFSMKNIHKDSVPSNATALPSVINTWFLQTKDGTMINTDSEGLYLNKSDSILEVIDENGEKYKYTGGDKVKVTSRDEVLQDDGGSFIIDSSNSVDKITRVYQETLTDQYYIYKLENGTGNSKVRTKVYLELQNVPVIAKVSMNANTVMTANLVVQSDEAVTDDTREQQYNMIVLPADLMTDDYVDIRLMTPAGQDFIVVSKARVTVPVNEDGSYIYDTIKMNLREDEILSMSSAIVEAYGLEGAKLYATKYVEAGMQQAASPTYTPNAAVTSQIDANGDGVIDNPNIVEKAKAELKSRYSDTAKKNRNDYLQSAINRADDYTDNVKKEATDDISSQNAARQRYLESLTN